MCESVKILWCEPLTYMYMYMYNVYLQVHVRDTKFTKTNLDQLPDTQHVYTA